VARFDSGWSLDDPAALRRGASVGLYPARVGFDSRAGLPRGPVRPDAGARLLSAPFAGSTPAWVTTPSSPRRGTSLRSSLSVFDSRRRYVLVVKTEIMRGYEPRVPRSSRGEDAEIPAGRTGCPAWPHTPALASSTLASATDPHARACVELADSVGPNPAAPEGMGVRSSPLAPP